jgi:signal transduction histidine kinase
MSRFRLTREREEAMDALEERENLLRMAQEVAGIGTFDLELATGQARFGGAYFRLYGLPPDHPPFSFDQWLDRVHPDDRARVKADTERAICYEREFSYEYRVIWPDGTMPWLLARGAILRDEAGRSQRLTGVNVDISAVKAAEQALLATNVELEQFAYSAGHDLQAPLRTINVFAELLQQTLASSADQDVRFALRHVRAGSQRMRMLDLLEFAQAGNNAGPELHLQPLEQSLHTALKNLHTDINKSQAMIAWDPLPHTRPFANEFAQVLQNLIGSAINYSKPETAPVIHVTCTLRDGDWLIAVKDNGTGFNPAQTSLIFQPFKRLVGEEQPGTGLGLPICKRIVERNCVDIWPSPNPSLGYLLLYPTKPGSVAVVRR